MYKEIIQVSLQFSRFSIINNFYKVNHICNKAYLKKKGRPTLLKTCRPKIFYSHATKDFVFLFQKKNKGKMKSKEAGLGR